MSTLTPIDPATLARRLKSGEITLVDIREPEEFAGEHIAGAISLPLSRLEAGHRMARGPAPIAFTCKTGMRTGANCGRLAAYLGEPAYVLEGGLEAWKKAGLAVARGRTA